MPVEFHIGYLAQYSVYKMVAYRGNVRRIFVKALRCDAKSLRHADDGGNVRGAAAHAALLMPAADELFYFQPRTDIQHADPLRAVKLMRRKGEHIRADLLYVQRYRARRLYGVGKKHDALRLAERGDLFDGLYRAHLVVCRHHADENRVGADGFFQFFKVYGAVFVHFGKGDFESLLDKFFCRGDHGRVLYRAYDEVSAPVRKGIRRTAQRPVVRLGAARSKINFRRFRADARGDLVARVVDGANRFPPEGVL